MVDQFGENFYLGPDADDKTFFYRDFTTIADCESPAGCNPVALGDLNGDQTVDSADYTLWRDSLGDEVTPFTGADANGDGAVNDRDRAAWLTHFGMSPGTISQGAQTPEPLSLGLTLGIVLWKPRPARPPNALHNRPARCDALNGPAAAAFYIRSASVFCGVVTLLWGSDLGFGLVSPIYGRSGPARASRCRWGSRSRSPPARC